jgi:hypothetical protein
MAENSPFSTFRSFERLRNYGGTVAAASSRRSRMTRLLDDYGSCATMGFLRNYGGMQGFFDISWF